MHDADDNETLRQERVGRDPALTGAIISGAAGATIAIARTITFLREGREPARPFYRGLPSLKPLRRTGDHQHQHHFLGGVAIGFSAAIAGLLSERVQRHPAASAAVGVGLGLTLDEIVLLWELRDRYWDDEHIVGAELAALLLLSTGLAGWRAVRGARGQGSDDAPEPPKEALSDE